VLTLTESFVHVWQGSRARCFGRFCCCTLLVALFVFISVVLSIVLVSVASVSSLQEMLMFAFADSGFGRRTSTLVMLPQEVR
jgi:hypothetical protein